MKFDFVIGNPPYQDETIGDNKGFAPPVYHKFLENSYKIGDVVEMIHPARFLFNAGSTPKQWNEQAAAVEQTEKYFQSGMGNEYLWNAKPRFGKTLSVYELCKKMEAQNVLIVTNRPAIANSWYSDYAKFLGMESGYQFVSNTDSLKGKKLVVSREDYVKANSISDNPYNCIEFVSLQDLKGSLYFGGDYDKLKEVADMNWDLLVIDEAHEGVDTYKTDVAFEHISRKYTLHYPARLLKRSRMINFRIMRFITGHMQMNSQQNVIGIRLKVTRIPMQHFRSSTCLLIRCQRLSRMS